MSSIYLEKWRQMTRSLLVLVAVLWMVGATWGVSHRVAHHDKWAATQTQPTNAEAEHGGVACEVIDQLLLAQGAPVSEPLFFHVSVQPNQTLVFLAYVPQTVFLFHYKARAPPEKINMALNDPNNCANPLT